MIKAALLWALSQVASGCKLSTRRKETTVYIALCTGFVIRSLSYVRMCAVVHVESHVIDELRKPGNTHFTKSEDPSASFRVSHQKNYSVDMLFKETVDILERLQVMKVQEKDPAYRFTDYLSKIEIFLSAESSMTESFPIDYHFREVNVYWAYQVVDYLNFRRDTVEICVRFIDLFLSSEVPATEEFLHCRKSFQLLSFTCLYMAIKLNEPKRLPLEHFLPLARGLFVEEDFIRMERVILQVLDWRVLCPTASQYLELIYRFIRLQDSMENNEAVHFIFHDARYQVELGIVEYALSLEWPSVLALAAIHNACNRLPLMLYSTFDRKRFMRVISSITMLLQPETALAQVQGRLCESILKNSLESSAHLVPWTEWEVSKKLRIGSPVSVVFRGPL